MNRRRLALALALVISPLTAQSADLMQVYEMARSGDTQLAIAESNRLNAREGHIQARAALLPQVEGGVQVGRTRTEIEGVPVTGNVRSRQYGINAGQTLFDWSRFANLRAQRALNQAADFTLEAANDDLIMRTAATYFNVLIAIESLAAAQSNETAAHKQFDYAQKRLAVGLAPITDMHEARAQYDQARAATILARNALEDASQALAELTGHPLEKSATDAAHNLRDLRGLPEDFRPQLPDDRGNVEQLVASAVAQNPLIRAQQLQVGAAESGVAAARARHYPNLSLAANWSKQDQSGTATGGGNPPDMTANSISLNLTIPIFSGGATQSGVRQALAQRDIAQEVLEQQRRQLDRNTRNAWQSLVAGISEVEARRLAVVSAQSAYDASQIGLEVGTRTVLDVVQNQRTLFQAQLMYVQAKYQFLQNRLALEQALGTLDAQVLQNVNRLLTEAKNSTGS